MDKSYKEDYIDFLDGLRGLMAFWVFLYHLSMTCIGRSTPWGSGATAVDIFMLLSGFLMAYHWMLRKNRFVNFKHQTIDFYIRRFFRIAPLYYILLIIAFLAQDYIFEMKHYISEIMPLPWANDSINRPTISDNTVNFKNILLHFSFLFGLFPQYSSNNILPDWSIGLEMQFYTVFPLLMLFLSRFGSFSIIVTLVIISFAMNKLFGLYLSPGVLGNFPQPSMLFFKINIFAAGISIALMSLKKDAYNTIRWGILATISLYNVTPQVWATALFIIFMLIFNNHKNEYIGRLLSTQIAKFLGDTSYAVYLAHGLIYIPILYILFKQEWFINLSMYPRLLVAFVFTAPPIYFVSYLLFKLIEVNGIVTGRKILTRLKLT